MLKFLFVAIVAAAASQNSGAGATFLTQDAPTLLNKPPKPEPETKVETKVEEKQPAEETLEEDVKVHTKKESAMPPVSTTMRCVINLSVQYFILYTVIALVRSYNDFATEKATGLQRLLTAACQTMNYAPMLCVLFLGVRMRAVQLSQGNTEEHELPQWWVQWAMESCAWSVLVQTIMVLLIPLALGGEPQVGADGCPKIDESKRGLLPIILTVVRYVAMLALYGGFTAVCIGAIDMKAPKEIWGDSAPPVSPAVSATMNLSIQYFAIYLAVAILTTAQQFGVNSDFVRKLEGVFQLAKTTVAFAPMLCILFIGARIRALQIDPKNGNPQKWAQDCFFLCAYAVLAQLILVIAVPLLFGGKVKQGETEGDVTFEMGGGSVIFWALSLVRYALMVSVYAGFTAVIVSVCLIENPNGPTPPVSPAMLCVMNLTVQFFLVYLLLWVTLTLCQVGLLGGMVRRVILPTLEQAKATVQFCPMLCVLFLGLRMRALQITENNGAPQTWAQEGMNLACWSVLVQILMVFLMPLFTGSAPKCDSDGNVVMQDTTSILAYFVVGIRYISFLALYGGAVSCVAALFMITPETANGAGGMFAPPALPTAQ